jgi:BirA family transcriptional regulator, biotin operon repressor / biotin---[acetyl-CoA-carboxylase] ligase
MEGYAGVERELQGTVFSKIRYVASTGSTNDDAAALLGNDDAAGLTIVAGFQTKGAGRKGRSWIAEPESALLMTTILPSPLPPGHLWIVPFGVAICVRRALFLSGVSADLHWPNDLLLGGRKLAGILCVSRVAGDRAYVAAGVGINLHRTPRAEAQIAPAPAFCDDVAPVEAPALLREILLHYDVWRSALDMPPRVARVWERQAGLPGKRYRILRDGESEPFEATALGLATGGGLIVRHDDGRRETISLADARALR